MKKKINPYLGHERDGVDLLERSNESALYPVGESLTVQSQAEDADLNVLMRRYGLTGHMPENPRLPMYGDFTEVRDYRSAVEAVQAAHEAFMEYPAEMRAKFQNDPQQFMDFCANEGNRAEMAKMGLLKQDPASFPAAGAPPAPAEPPKGTT